jgi:hypothetical protein
MVYMNVKSVMSSIIFSRHCLDKTRTRWNDFLFLIIDDRDFRPQTCTNGLDFRECKHIKNIFEDVYFTKNLFHITLKILDITDFTFMYTIPPSNFFWTYMYIKPSKIFLICLHSLKSKPFVHVWGRKSRSSMIKNRKSFHLVRVLSRQWRLINFRMHRSNDCRSWNFITNVNRRTHVSFWFWKFWRCLFHQNSFHITLKKPEAHRSL